MKARNETYDLVINNGRVMDPETSLDAVRNVGVRDGKIVVITAQAITGQETIDATGHVVAPGFIDGHSHAANDAFGVKKGILDGRTTIMDLGPVPGPWTSGTTALNGEFSVEPASGFGADYDETVEVHEVRLVSKEGTDTCRGERSLAKSEVAVGGEPSTYVFVCNDDLVYTVRATGTEAWVFRPEGTHRLSVVPTEKGASYADGVFELWIRGTAGAARRDRRPAAVMSQRSASCGVGKGQARWRGLSGGGERAGMELGNFREKSHGADRRLWRQSRIGLPLPEPTVGHDARSTWWDAGEIILEVIGHPCHDSMSGEAFETEVIVNWKGRTFRGCGRALH